MRLSQYQVVSLLQQREKLQVLELLGENNRLSFKSWLLIIKFIFESSFQSTQMTIMFMCLQCAQKSAVRRGFIKGQTLGKFSSCIGMTFSSWFDHLEERFITAQFKTFCPAMKTSCPPTKNFIVTHVFILLTHF